MIKTPATIMLLSAFFLSCGPDKDKEVQKGSKFSETTKTQPIIVNSDNASQSPNLDAILDKYIPKEDDIENGNEENGSADKETYIGGKIIVYENNNNKPLGKKVTMVYDKFFKNYKITYLDSKEEKREMVFEPNGDSPNVLIYRNTKWTVSKENLELMSTYNGGGYGNLTFQKDDYTMFFRVENLTKVIKK